MSGLVTQEPATRAAAATEHASGLHCRMCSRPYLAEDVNVDEALAFCRECHTVRDLPSNAAALSAAGAERPEQLPPAVRPKQALPRGFKVEELPGCLRISWKEPIDGPLAGLLFWLGMPLLLLYKKDAPFPWERIPTLPWEVPPLYLAVYLLVALGLLSVLVANLVNFTSVEASREHLLVSHGPVPVPWRRRRKVLAADIDQVFSCRYRASRNSHYFGVGAVARVDGDWRTVVSGLRQAEQALYLEQQFERRLGIIDRPVKGELKRSKS